MTEKIVSCYLMGGLGNQLFQIFTTITYGIDSQSTIIFPYSEVLTTGIERPTYWDTFLQQLKSFTTIKKSCVYNHTDPYRFVKYQEAGFKYNRIPIVENRELMLFGYFQSYLYFEHCKQTIFSMIRLDKQKAEIREEFSYIFTRKTSNNTNIHNISMHFRLGDYKLNPDCHPIMPFEYYSNSLGQLISITDSKQIFRVLYFCEEEDDDYVNSIISLLSLSYSFIEFIKVNNEIPDWKQLLIMSCCNDNIIANSSFSWWGAYFNDNVNKHVCYPSVWFGPKIAHDVSNLFPPNWNKVTW